MKPPSGKWHLKKRGLSFLLCFVLMLSMAACKPSSGEAPAALSPVPSVEETTPVPDYAQPVAYVWQPYVLSELYRGLYGDAFVADYKAMIDAFLSYETTFPCADAETVTALNAVAPSWFPLLYMDVGYVQYDEVNQVGLLSYALPEAAHFAGIEAFKQSVSQFITENVMRSDSACTTALALYMAFSARVRYDYAALDTDVLVDVSPYRALTTYEGICQCFGPAYAYLCLQTGIEAVSAGGLSTDDTAHAWTLVELDGSYFYMDPTYENGEGGLGLKYFGMTSAERVSAGNYIEEFINVGDCNLLWGPDITVDDTRFSALHTVALAEINRAQQQIDCTNADGTVWSFPLD